MIVSLLIIVQENKRCTAHVLKYIYYYRTTGYSYFSQRISQKGWAVSWFHEL